MFYNYATVQMFGVSKIVIVFCLCVCVCGIPKTIA